MIYPGFTTIPSNYLLFLSFNFLKDVFKFRSKLIPFRNRNESLLPIGLFFFPIGTVRVPMDFFSLSVIFFAIVFLLLTGSIWMCPLKYQAFQRFPHD